MVNGVGGSANNAVTFVNNHDFRDPGQPVTNNPELAYAYILTNNFLGVPCVYYQDYFTTNFMRGRIKGLMHANQKYIKGATSVDYLSRFNSPYNQVFPSRQLASTTVIYQQMNNPVTNEDVIVAINFAGDSLDVYQQVNLANLSVGDTLTDIFGVAYGPQLTTITPNHELHVLLPPRSFAVYVKGVHTDSAGLVSLGDTIAPVVVPNGIETATSSADFASIYPNPFSSMIMVAMNGTRDENVAVQLSDISGRLIYSDSGMTQNGKLVINPDIENPGIYFLRVSTKNRSESYKVLKQ
jgi:alpha-amylase